MTQAGLDLGVSDYEAVIMDALRELVAAGGHKDVAHAAGISQSALSDHLANRERKRANETIVAAALLVAHQKGEQLSIIRFANRLLLRFSVEAKARELAPAAVVERFKSALAKHGDFGRDIVAYATGTEVEP